MLKGDEFMIIFPAIDLKDGLCVRLTEGRFDQQTIFSDSPGQMAERWQYEGAEYLHVVDLDGALAGKSKNMQAIKEIVSVCKIPVQVGGGIRNQEAIEAMLGLGVARVILGSVVVKNPDFVKVACKEYGEKIVVGIDARDNQVAVEGWGIAGGIKAGELAKKMAQVGVTRVVFTDIARDGMLSGVNVEATVQLAKESGLKVIASGGVTSLDDIKELKEHTAEGIEGAIVGKAIYTGALDLQEIIKLAK